MRLILIITLFFCVCFADTITLKSGTKIECDIINLNLSDLKVRKEEKIYVYHREYVKKIERSNKENEYLRYSKVSENYRVLETCLKIFVNVKTKKVLTLVSVVHFADSKYYSILQSTLDIHDVVLFEGVGSPYREIDFTEWKPSRKLWPKASNSFDGFNNMVCYLLNLEDQLDNINYNRDFWVNADISATELCKLYAKRKAVDAFSSNRFDIDIEIYLDVAKKISKLKNGLKDFNYRGHLKDSFAKYLIRKKVHKAKSAKMKAILIDRNDVALKKLKQVEKSKTIKSISIFYGAAHMPDLEKKIEKMGYSEVTEIWDIAWEIEL